MSHLMTGIKDPDEEIIRETLGIADKLVRDAWLDSELRMLSITTSWSPRIWTALRASMLSGRRAA
jgi:hypothetical protein